MDAQIGPHAEPPIGPPIRPPVGPPHIAHMRRALALAVRGRTSPNPMVGCVVVKGGRILGEGYHARAGAPHAETVALAQAGAAARGATLYVTLEPCAHHGRTPPCTDAIIAAGAARVFYAAADPHPRAGGGAARLAAAGVEVNNGPCRAEAEALNRAFFVAQTRGRPFVTAKFAASLDGRIATARGHSKWITGPAARARAHELRQACDALIIGVETVIADDPALTARPDSGAPAHPLRIVLDSRGRTPIEAQIISGKLPGATLIATTAAAPAAFREAAARHGAEILELAADAQGRVALAPLIAALAARGLLHVMVEGGAQTLASFFRARLVDEVWAFLAPRLIGGDGRPAIEGFGAETLAQAFTLADAETEIMDGDILIRGQIAPDEMTPEIRPDRREIPTPRPERMAACLPG